MTACRAPALLLLAGLANVAGAQARWVVDRGGGGQFTEIQPAIAAASPGDRIRVVGPGPYAAFLLAKGVDLEALPAATVESAHVADVPVGQWARVAGFVAGGIVPNEGASVVVQRCAGPVLLSSLRASSGLVVEGSASVLLLRSTANGPAATWGSFTGFPGLRVRQSRLTVQDCSLVGGQGLAGSPLSSPTPGGPALSATDTQLLVHQSAVQGGLGGFPYLQGIGAAGGAALLARGSGASLVMGGGSLAGGQGTATAPNGAAADSSPVQAQITSDVTLQGALRGAVLVGALPALASPGVATRGAPVTLQLSGPPGTLVLPYLDGRHGHQLLPGIGQPFLLSLAAVPLPVQVLVGGTHPWTLQVPADAALADLIVLFQGVAVLPATQTVTLTNLGDLRLR
jgi:hypothetical protein